MNAKAESRELFRLDGIGGAIWGTCHWPGGYEQNTDAGHYDPRRIGVIFLSGVAATRSANGDVAAYWADALAKRGYPFFRIDLPGYGDAGGDPPADWIIHIAKGRDGVLVTDAIRRLSARFGLSQVVIAGHCSGAVSAIFSAVKSKTCKGLVLMDPFFQLPLQEPSKIRITVSSWASRLGVHQFLRLLHGSWKQVWHVFRGGVCPGNINTPLLQCWSKVAAAGTPVLIVRSPGQVMEEEREKSDNFDYLGYFQKITAGHRDQLTMEIVNGSHHSFANRVGRAAVLDHMESWLDTHFPLKGAGAVGVEPGGMKVTGTVGNNLNRGGSRAECGELTR